MRFESVGLRLIAAFIGIFCLFLAAATFSGYAVLDQYRGLRELKEGRFDQAVRAADLSREAEVMTSEVLERLLGIGRSQAADNTAIYNLIDVYEQNLRILEASSGGNDPFLARTHLWQSDYLDGIRTLSNKITAERDLDEKQSEVVDDLARLTIPVTLDISDQSARLYAITAMLKTSIALKTEGPGQLERLHDGAKLSIVHLQSRLDAINAPDSERTIANALQDIVKRAFDTRLPMLHSQRATLSAARQSRILAQKITSGTHGYYLEQRAATNAALQQQQDVLATTAAIIITVILATGGLIILLIAYVNRRITRRLIALRDSMLNHVNGSSTPIDTNGQDEIADMARAFEIFVTARKNAENDLRAARIEAENSRDLVTILAATDGLCGIPNRRSFDERLNYEWNRCARSQAPLSLAFIDIDHFKLFNDNYGHVMGDDCLKQMANIITQAIERSTDFSARYGGEEFACVLPETTAQGCRTFAEKLRLAIEKAARPHAYSPTASHVTVSIGIATLIPQHGTSSKDLIQQADLALYAAKANGRNQVG